MKKLCLPAALRSVGVAVCLAAGAMPAVSWGATEIQVWHALNAHNKAVFDDLVKQFNGAQNDVKVNTTAYDSLPALEAALQKVAKTPKQAPNLVQLDEQRELDGVTKHSYIQPMHVLLAKYPIKDQQWFLSRHNSYGRDAQGRLVAFPYMADIPVMFYNVDAFKTAGLQPTVPDRAWDQLQGQLVTLANNGSRQCPLTSDQTVSMNLENLAAINNQLYTTENNGIGQKSHPSFLFDTTYVRHLSLMISWVRSELMVRPELSSQAVSRFAKRECAVLVSSSGNLGSFLKSKDLSFGVSGLPYYPQVTKKPGNPFVGGSALWAIKGHEAGQDKGSAAFLGWLAQPKNAALWHQNTGFLPLTRDAFNLTLDTYYKPLGEWESLVKVYINDPSNLNRGFRVNNYPQIRAMFEQNLEKALRGEQPAVTALQTSSAEAGKIMRGR